MNSIEIIGGNTLHGEISIQGSKNGVLPILAGSILIAGVTVLYNCPKIIDVEYMIQILEKIGCRCIWSDHTLTINATRVREFHIPIEYAKEMRSSVIFMGSLLGRKKKALLPHPGGCVIGDRPINIHLDSFRKMHVKIKEKDNYLFAKVKNIKSTELFLDSSSVGATENIILASVLSKGSTLIHNAAKEPEIMELCNFLNKAGANITGAGSKDIEITGVKRLHNVTYHIMADRIVAGTYLLAAAATRGDVLIKNAPVGQLEALIEQLKSLGALIEISDKGLRIRAQEADRKIPYLKTEPFPGFPTDLQSPMLVALALAKGNSVIEETIFEQRYRIVEELVQMGADISIKGNKAYITGVTQLKGNTVRAKELRGGAALVIAGLAAAGKTTILNAHFIARGYEDICLDLRRLGADIRYY